MPGLVHLDFLRRVTPNVIEASEGLDFIIFGGFDAMRVGLHASDLSELKKKHEEGHDMVESSYDRQPVFLYHPSLEGEKSEQDIFCRDGEYSDLPVVISIIQLNKTIYAGTSTPSAKDLVFRFNQMIQQYLDTDRVLQKNERFCWSVFWNMGEADVGVVFRAEKLQAVAKVLQALRIQQKEETPVFSTCSHCGFPYQKTKEETGREIKKWLDREGEDQKTGILSLINTSSAFHHLNDREGEKKISLQGFLFGEWDYAGYFPSKQVKTEDVLSHMMLAAYPKKQQLYKTSYTIPVVQMDQFGDVSGDPLDDEEDWIDRIQDSFKALSETVSGEAEKTIIRNSQELILSLGRTVKGLAKYLIRLYKGRFEQDLYAYCKPVFVALPRIIQDYQKQIEFTRKLGELTQAEKETKISRLTAEMVDDCTKMISSFQHLFTVLSVSPHTFIETFGSNMRSLSAADKLADAYQGVVSFLCKNFPDQVGEQRNGSHFVLIVPYRQSYPNHTLFFRSTCPDWRISQIEMDFPRMFDIGASIYVILHECGHHLGNRLRGQRWRQYMQGCLYLSAESMLGNYQQEPVSSLISAIGNRMVSPENSSLFLGLDEESRDTIIRNYSSRIADQAQKGIGRLASVLEAMITEIENQPAAEGRTIRERLKPVFEGQFIEGQYSVYTYSYVIGLLRSVFPEEENGLNSRKRNILASTIQEGFVQPMTRIAEALAAEIVNNGGNAYEASKLVAKYRSGRITEELADNLPRQVQEKIKENALSDLLTVFNDVYADLFAIKILDIQAPEDYCRLLGLFTGAAAYRALINETNLMRIAAIGQICFQADTREEAFFQKFLKENAVQEWEKRRIAEIWEMVTRSLSFQPVLEYGQECAHAIEQMVAKVSGRSEQEIKVMRDAFKKKDMATEIRFIETFWTYLLRNGPAHSMSTDNAAVPKDQTTAQKGAALSRSGS